MGQGNGKKGEEACARREAKSAGPEAGKAQPAKKNNRPRRIGNRRPTGLIGFKTNAPSNRRASGPWRLAFARQMRRRQALRSEGNAGRGSQTKKPESADMARRMSIPLGKAPREGEGPSPAKITRRGQTVCASRRDSQDLAVSFDVPGVLAAAKAPAGKINAAIDGAALASSPSTGPERAGSRLGAMRRSCSWPK